MEMDGLLTAGRFVARLILRLLEVQGELAEFANAEGYPAEMDFEQWLFVLLEWIEPEAEKPNRLAQMPKKARRCVEPVVGGGGVVDLIYGVKDE